MTGGTSSVTITTDVMSEDESDKVVEGLKINILIWVNLLLEMFNHLMVMNF